MRKFFFAEWCCHHQLACGFYSAGNNNSSSTSSTRNLWVSGLSSNTKAADLKNLFGKYGKVSALFALG